MKRSQLHLCSNCTYWGYEVGESGVWLGGKKDSCKTAPIIRIDTVGGIGRIYVSCSKRNKRGKVCPFWTRHKSEEEK